MTRSLAIEREPATNARDAHPQRTARSFRIFLLLLTAMGLAGCLERLFFYPDSATYARPEQYGLRHEDVFIDTADGARLHGWWLPARGPALGSVLHLHGNAANVSNHLPPSRDDPATAIGSVRVPLLIVHGTADEVIPFAHSERLAAAAPLGTVFLPVAGARHLESLTRTDVQQQLLQAMIEALR